MTGFARADGFADGYSWTWEIKSVNSRSLDTRFRLPNGFDAMESRLRTALPERFTRGNISASRRVRHIPAPVPRRYRWKRR